MSFTCIKSNIRSNFECLIKRLCKSTVLNDYYKLHGFKCPKFGIMLYLVLVERTELIFLERLRRFQLEGHSLDT